MPAHEASVNSRYILGELIAQGGMGAVFRAQDQVLRRRVAVKLLLKRFEPGSAVSRRFEDEARITARLQHPGIPPVHDLGILPDGQPFLAMKLIEGQTLQELLKTRGEPSSDRSRFLAVFEQVCQAVAYAHACGVIHRDLKPANIMVGEFGEVQVMDWGLAKEIDSECEEMVPSAPRNEIATTVEADSDRTTDYHPAEESTEDRTKPGHALGTPAFMPPEQARGELDRVDRRSDVFSLGGILCSILTGGPTFRGSSSEAMRRASLGDLEETHDRLMRSGADLELITLCTRCLAADPSERPADAVSVASEIGTYRFGVEERLRRLERDQAVTLAREQELQRRRRVVRLLFGILAAFICAIGLGTSFALLWRTAERDRTLAEQANENLDAEQKRTSAALHEAVRLKGEVERERARIAMFEHGRRMQVAHQEWRENRLASARAILAGVTSEYRGWEWNYLNRLCNPELVTFNGHTHPVTSAAFDPSGRYVVSSAEDGSVKIWEAASGRLVKSLVGHTDRVTCASFSRDGSRIVTASWDGTARVWEVASGEAIRTVSGIASMVSFLPVAFARLNGDATRLITSNSKSRATVWNVMTGREEFSISGHTNDITDATFNPDGTRILTASWDKTARVWDGGAGSELLALKGHTDRVTSVEMDPAGKRIITGSWDGTTRVWDAITGKVQFVAEHQKQKVHSCRFGPEGQQFLVACEDGHARICDAKNGSPMYSLKGGHTKGLSHAAFSQDGRRIVTASYDSTVKIWDSHASAEALILDGHPVVVDGAIFHPHGTQVATVSERTARIWDADSGRLLRTLSGHGGYGGLSACFIQNGSHLATSCHDGKLRIWNIERGELAASFSGAETKLMAIVGSPHSNTVVTVCGVQLDKQDARSQLPQFQFRAQVWDIERHQEVHQDDRLRDVGNAAFSLDGSTFATCSKDGWIRVWDARTGSQRHAWKDTCGRLALDASGQHALVGNGHTACLWDARSGEKKSELKGHVNHILSLAIHPDGLRAATGSADGTTKIWDTKTGAEVLTLDGHGYFVTGVSFSSDGTRLLTCAGRTAKIYDSRSLKTNP